MKHATSLDKLFFPVVEEIPISNLQQTASSDILTTKPPMPDTNLSSTLNKEIQLEDILVALLVLCIVAGCVYLFYQKTITKESDCLIKS